jgi:hypothetical protein
MYRFGGSVQRKCVFVVVLLRRSLRHGLRVGQRPCTAPTPARASDSRSQPALGTASGNGRITRSSSAQQPPLALRSEDEAEQIVTASVGSAGPSNLLSDLIAPDADGIPAPVEQATLDEPAFNIGGGAHARSTLPSSGSTAWTRISATGSFGRPLALPRKTPKEQTVEAAARAVGVAETFKASFDSAPTDAEFAHSVRRRCQCVLFARQSPLTDIPG